MNEWLDGLKPGDKVDIGRHGHPHPAVVSRRTKTQIVVKHGEVEIPFRSRDGHRRSGSGIWDAGMTEWTDEKAVLLRRQEMLGKVAAIKWSEQPDEVLRQVLELTERKEG